MKKVLLVSMVAMVVISMLSACGYTPTSYENATNKQMQDFHAWEQKQNQKSWENQKANK